MVKQSIHERRERFLLLLGTFLVTVGIIGTGIFYGSIKEGNTSASELKLKLAQDAEFEAAVNQQRKTVDSTFKQITDFDPTVNAVFLTNDIKYSLNAIRTNYDRNAFNPHYKIFLHTALLYEVLLFNRRELKGNTADLEGLKKSLEDCKLSSNEFKGAMQPIH